MSYIGSKKYKERNMLPIVQKRAMINMLQTNRRNHHHTHHNYSNNRTGCSVGNTNTNNSSRQLQKDIYYENSQTSNDESDYLEELYCEFFAYDSPYSNLSTKSDTGY